MKETNIDFLIIGAGLSGLTIARELQKNGQTFLLLEARDRTGGRILTNRTSEGVPLEMGATWLGKKHTALVGLLRELKIPVFEQVTGGRAIYEAISTSPPQVVQLPENDEPSFRIAGGSEVLIRKLTNALPPDSLQLNTVVKHIRLEDERVLTDTDKGLVRSSRVISTLPPYLFIRTISVDPPLPDTLMKIASTTHTWMGESIKVGLRYARPFWREGGVGGTIFSNVGPVSEMYDHSDVEDAHYALKGFLNGAYYAVTEAERRELVLHQLRKYYGDVVDDYLSYEEAVWRQEPFTFQEYTSHVLPHQHNGHPVYQSTFLDGRLLLAGSETATAFPGYMDGAVRCAQECLARWKAHA